MGRYISENIREFVIERSKKRCEYCRIFALYSYLSFHIEHIISLKHGGKTVINNLAYACPICNTNKGTDIATFLDSVIEPIRFFNPRIDTWNDHFEVKKSGLIIPITNIEEATIKILDFNHPDSIIERQLMIGNNFF